MRRKIILLLLVCALLSLGRNLLAQTDGKAVVRLAELEIEPAQVEGYKAALKEEIETSTRVEPGVLKLYAVSVKGHPEQIRLFEMYASPAAYESHLRTEHFLKYKTATQGMVKALKLVETEPIVLGGR